MADQQPVKLLIINPNTTQSMTQGLRNALIPLTPPGTQLTFYTAPAELGAPPAISDISTGVQSAQACARDIVNEKKLLDVYDGFLVCCCEFSVRFFLTSGFPFHPCSFVIILPGSQDRGARCSLRV